MNAQEEPLDTSEESKPLLLRVKQVAKLLQLGEARVYQMVSFAQIGHLREGRSIRIPAEEVTAWIRKKRRQTGC